MKLDEKELLKQLKKETVENANKPYVWNLVLNLNMNQKRAAYILEKWTCKGWYDYGVNVFNGWLTDEGLDT